jgi:predicted transcriptional regulator
LYVYKGNYLSCQEKLGKVSVVMETIGKRHQGTTETKLPLIQNEQSCDFNGYDADILMKETAKLRHTLKGFSSKTLAARLKELQRSGVLERKSYNETPPRVEYNLTDKGQELVESVINLLQWMRKWSSAK